MAIQQFYCVQTCIIKLVSHDRTPGASVVVEKSIVLLDDIISLNPNSLDIPELINEVTGIGVVDKPNTSSVAFISKIDHSTLIIFLFKKNEIVFLKKETQRAHYCYLARILRYWHRRRENTLRYNVIVVFITSDNIAVSFSPEINSRQPSRRQAERRMTKSDYINTLRKT